MCSTLTQSACQSLVTDLLVELRWTDGGTVGVCACEFTEHALYVCMSSDA